MAARRHTGRAVAPHAPQPPDIARMAPIAFGDEDRAALATWLDRAGWPRGTMDITTVEGYLVGLLTWPVNLTSGAWLPRIWNDNGWRVPRIIDDPAAFTQFVDLIAGYLQWLDRSISIEPSTFAPNLAPGARYSGQKVSPEVAWAAGFRAAMQMGAHGSEWMSAPVRSAVDTIAEQFSRPLGSPAERARRELTGAILVLAHARQSRGPLGALPAVPGKSKKHGAASPGASS